MSTRSKDIGCRGEMHTIIYYQFLSALNLHSIERSTNINLPWNYGILFIGVLSNPSDGLSVCVYTYMIIRICKRIQLSMVYFNVYM